MDSGNNFETRKKYDVIKIFLATTFVQFGLKINLFLNLIYVLLKLI